MSFRVLSAATQKFGRLQPLEAVPLLREGRPGWLRRIGRVDRAATAVGGRGCVRQLQRLRTGALKDDAP